MNTQPIHDKILSFLGKANAFLKDKGLFFYYGGQFVSGNLSSACETLILSLNPGFSKEDGWDDMSTPPECKHSQHQDKRLKYLDENTDFAKMVRSVFSDDEGKLSACAETCVYSPFASPSKKEIDASLNALDPDLWDEHNNLRMEMVASTIEQLKPSNILIISSEVFEGFQKWPMKSDPALEIVGGGPVDDTDWTDGVVWTGQLANGCKLFVSRYHFSARHWDFPEEKKELVRKHAKSFF